MDSSSRMSIGLFSTQKSKLSNGSNASWPTGKLWTTLISLPKSALCFSYSNEFWCATTDMVSVGASSLLLAPNNHHKKRGPKPWPPSCPASSSVSPSELHAQLIACGSRGSGRC